MIVAEMRWTNLLLCENTTRNRKRMERFWLAWLLTNFERYINSNTVALIAYWTRANFQQVPAVEKYHSVETYHVRSCRHFPANWGAAEREKEEEKTLAACTMYAASAHDKFLGGIMGRGGGGWKLSCTSIIVDVTYRLCLCLCMYLFPKRTCTTFLSL